LKDTTPPKIEAVWLVYRDDGSLFEGGVRELKLKPVTTKTGRTIIPDTILVTGRFGLEAAIEDAVVPGSFMIGPERVTLTIDDIVYHQVEYDRLDYAENRLSLLDRDPDPAKGGYDRVYVLYRRPGNTLSNYRSDVPGDGTFADTDEGFHDLAIEAADAFGNVRRLEFTVFYSPSGRLLSDRAEPIMSDSLIRIPLAKMAERAAFDTVMLYGVGKSGRDSALASQMMIGDDTLALSGRFARFRRFKAVFLREGASYPSICFTRPSDSAATATISSGSAYAIAGDGLLCTAQTDAGGINRLIGVIATDRGIDTLFYRQVAPGRFAGYYCPAAAVAVINDIVIDGDSPWVPDTMALGIHHLIAGQPARLEHGDDLTIECDADDLFGDALVQIIDTVVPPPPTAGFLHRPFALLPDWLAFANPLRLMEQFTTLPDTTKTAFYIHRNGESWAWVGRRVDPDDRQMTATVSGGGVYTLFTDTAAPTITGLNIADKQALTSGRPQIRCIVGDDLSGFEDDRNFDITIDGKWVIPEYDFDQKLLTGRPSETIRGTGHVLKIVVRDRCGNITTVTRTFHVISKTGPR
jgi:hypothetical protein